VNATFGLTIGVVVVGGGHFKLNLKVLHKLLSEVRGKSTVSISGNIEGLFMNSEYLVQKDLGSLLSIDILVYREQVCIGTEVINDNKNELAFLIIREWTHKIQGEGLEKCLWNRHCPWLPFRDLGRYLVDLAKVASVAEVYKVLVY
jgi:hypothetical protein